jgi:carbon storage regulator
MLVLTRKPGETVILDNKISVTVASVVGNKVRLGFVAPDDVRILRGELACWLPKFLNASTKKLMRKKDITDSHHEGPLDGEYN